MATIARPAAYLAAVAVLLLSGIGVGLPIDSVRADDNCLSAPGAAPPAGQHWYYRTDWVKNRKCWYLRATMPLPNNAAAEASEPVLSVATPQPPSAATPQATNAAPAPQPAPDASNTLSEAASTQPAPHITVLSAKPAPALFAGTISAFQAATPEQAGEPPMPQISPDNVNVPVDGDAKSANGANPATVPGATDANLNTFAPADAVTTASVRTQSADLLLLLALGFGLAAGLIALFSKMVGRPRTPRLSGHPDDASRGVIHEDDAPFLAPQEPEGSAELAADDWIEESPPAQADFPVERPQDREPAQSEQVGLTLKDIELALRAVRQARQSIART